MVGPVSDNHQDSTNYFKLKVWIFNDFLKFIYQLSIEFQIRDTVLQKFLQIYMIFFDQFIVFTIKFGKCFAEFMIPIALLKRFGS